MPKFTKQEEVRAIIERSVEADNLEQAEEKFDNGESDTEKVIDILETIESYPVEQF